MRVLPARFGPMSARLPADSTVGDAPGSRAARVAGPRTKRGGRQSAVPPERDDQQQERRLEDVHARDDERDDQRQRVADEPAGGRENAATARNTYRTPPIRPARSRVPSSPGSTRRLSSIRRMARRMHARAMTTLAPTSAARMSGGGVATTSRRSPSSRAASPHERKAPDEQPQQPAAIDRPGRGRRRCGHGGSRATSWTPHQRSATRAALARRSPGPPGRPQATPGRRALRVEREPDVGR